MFHFISVFIVHWQPQRRCNNHRMCRQPKDSKNFVTVVLLRVIVTNLITTINSPFVKKLRHEKKDEFENNIVNILEKYKFHLFFARMQSFVTEWISTSDQTSSVDFANSTLHHRYSTTSSVCRKKTVSWYHRTTLSFFLETDFEFCDSIQWKWF